MENHVMEMKILLPVKQIMNFDSKVKKQVTTQRV